MPKLKDSHIIDNLLDDVVNSLLESPGDELDTYDEVDVESVRLNLLKGIESADNVSSGTGENQHLPKPCTIIHFKSQAEPLRIARFGARMTCAAAMALAHDRHDASEGAFMWDTDDIHQLDLGQRLPPGFEVSPNGDTTAAMIVTLGPQAQLANLHGEGRWRTVFAMSHRETELLVSRKSGLADLRDTELAGRLRGKYIAVTDRRSIFALRLASLCRTIGTRVNVFPYSQSHASYPSRDNRNRLNLIEMPPDTMLRQFGRTLDGFAAGEPYPSIALLEHGYKNVGMATIDVTATEIPISTPFCCVTVIDELLIKHHHTVYLGLLDEMVQMLLRFTSGEPTASTQLLSYINKARTIPEPAALLASAKSVRHMVGHLMDALDHYTTTQTQFGCTSNQTSHVPAMTDTEVGIRAQPGISLSSLREELALIRDLNLEEAKWSNTHLKELISFDPEQLYEPLSTSRELLVKAIRDYGAEQLRIKVEAANKQAQEVITQQQVA